MDKLNKGDKIYLDSDKLKESEVNRFLSCRDGIVEVYEYQDESGYGVKTRLFLCQDNKREVVSIIRQKHNSISNKWIEESMYFDTDSFLFVTAIVKGNKYALGGDYTLVRDY